jgi:hypothetical protein
MRIHGYCSKPKGVRGEKILGYAGLNNTEVTLSHPCARLLWWKRHRIRSRQSLARWTLTRRTRLLSDSKLILQIESRRRWVKYWDLRQKKDRVIGKPKTRIMQGDNKQSERIQIFIDRKAVATQHIHAHCCQVQLREVSFVRYPSLIRAPFVVLASCRTVDRIIYLQE